MSIQAPHARPFISPSSFNAFVEDSLSSFFLESAVSPAPTDSSSLLSLDSLTERISSPTETGEMIPPKSLKSTSPFLPRSPSPEGYTAIKTQQVYCKMNPPRAVPRRSGKPLTPMLFDIDPRDFIKMLTIMNDPAGELLDCNQRLRNFRRELNEKKLMDEAPTTEFITEGSKIVRRLQKLSKNIFKDPNFSDIDKQALADFINKTTKVDRESNLQALSAAAALKNKMILEELRT